MRIVIKDVTEGALRYETCPTTAVDGQLSSAELASLDAMVGLGEGRKRHGLDRRLRRLCQGVGGALVQQPTEKASGSLAHIIARADPVVSHMAEAS